MRHPDWPPGTEEWETVLDAEDRDAEGPPWDADEAYDFGEFDDDEDEDGEDE